MDCLSCKEVVYSVKFHCDRCVDLSYDQFQCLLERNKLWTERRMASSASGRKCKGSFTYFSEIAEEDVQDGGDVGLALPGPSFLSPEFSLLSFSSTSNSVGLSLARDKQ